MSCIEEYCNAVPCSPRKDRVSRGCVGMCSLSLGAHYHSRYCELQSSLQLGSHKSHIQGSAGRRNPRLIRLSCFCKIVITAETHCTECIAVPPAEHLNTSDAVLLILILLLGCPKYISVCRSVPRAKSVVTKTFPSGALAPVTLLAGQKHGRAVACVMLGRSDVFQPAKAFGRPARPTRDVHSCWSRVVRHVHMKGCNRRHKAEA